MVTRLYYWLVYRRLMTVMHRYGWHHMKHHSPLPPHTDMPDGFLKCDWCGIHSDIPYSMRARKVEAMEGFGWGFLAREAPEAILKAQVRAMNVGGEVMSEYDELVKGARAWKVGPFDDYAEKVALVDDLCDAIEALVGDVKELTADVDALIADVSSLGDNLDKVAAERDYFRDAFKDCANREAMILQREAERARASQSEVERLKGVLGPVLEIAERNEPGLATQAARSALEAKP